MKKLFTLFLIVALMISLSGVKAQTSISLGARAGLNFANLSFDPDIQGGLSKSSRTGFSIGGLAEISFAKMFALQIEPMYLQGGAVIDNVNFGFTTGKVTFKQDYIEIPILFKVKIPTPGNVVPYAFVGPNLQFVLSSKQLSEAGGQSQDQDIKDQTSSFNFALDFGAGAGYEVAPMTTLMLDIRYSLGLVNLLNDKGKQSFGANQSIKSSGFQIVAGVMFGLN